ncbi:MAG: 4-(cytidine 5'-diphospho)-2-C-methyl-D-erythritol kinase, partial [Acidimicrobiia bacterium]
DGLRLRHSEEDEFTAEGMEADSGNLAWRAVEAARSLALSGGPVGLTLSKEIPVAAGLGGGSADAAAALGLAAELWGVATEALAGPALELGADLPFCLTGGLAMLEGRGERVTAQPAAGSFALAIVVPPLELSTPSVYRQWDEMEGPTGVAVSTSHIPPGLRPFQPLRNDLQPAAEALEPAVAEWRQELASRWQRPVAMTGSGPALFAYFIDEDEAASALGDRPEGARAARAVVPVSQGWRRVPGTMAGPE